MIYTEEDLKQAYDMGYNEAVDDVNDYIEQESMEFSLDESYDEDYSAVEDMICNEKTEYGSPEWVRRKHISNAIRIANKAGVDPNKAVKGNGEDLSPDDKVNLRGEIRKNGFYNGGLKKAKEKYNAYHARKGDGKHWN